jgi:DNA (cytosine-5)-methyltransferase 1
MRKPTVLDCFCGAGGMSLGFKNAGFRLVAAYDNCEPAISTYKRNLGRHGYCVDLKSTPITELRAGQQIDVVVGGPPCQGFSVQRRGGRADTRNDLVFHFLKIVEEIRPAFFLMENVPALAGPRWKSYFDRLLGTAAKLGYQVKTEILNAADFGVPQVRRRLFLVGEHSDRQPSFEFPCRTRAPDDYVTVREAIGRLPEPRPKNEKPRLPNHISDNISELNRRRIATVPPGGGRADIPTKLQLPCHRVSVDVAGHRGVYGRLWWDRPATTITTKCNSFTRGRFAHPEAHRNISMREAARLQSFPDDFVFEGSVVDVAHQIGNAVPPLLARALAEAIMKALRCRAPKKRTRPGGEQLRFVFTDTK